MSLLKWKHEDNWVYNEERTVVAECLTAEDAKRIVDLHNAAVKNAEPNVQQISFSETTFGDHYIKVDGSEVVIRTRELNKDGQRVVLNGIKSLLSSVICYM